MLEMPLTERDTNIPPKLTTRVSPSFKTPQPHSRLPRLVATPKSAPAVTKWTSPAAFGRNSSAGMRYTPTLGRELTVVESNQKAPKPTPPAKDKPLPHEKVLPPRPVARLSTDPSPTKDSRGLIDACELPLHIASVSGDKREWPTLRPQPSRSPSATPPVERRFSQLYFQSPAFSPSVAAASASAVATDITTMAANASTKRDSKRSSHSPASSYVSAKESNSQITASYKSSRDLHETDHHDTINLSRRTFSNASTNTDLPARKASLRSRISNGSLITPTLGSRHQVMTMTDFTKPDTASSTSTESRTHSPSPASFSRPRPGSISSGIATPKSMKTASRIPIPDSKKATMVELKKDLQSAPTIPKPSAVPTFGSRRLASPEALKILENGKMRRQMQRTPTNASNNPQVRTANQESESEEAKMPSSSYSRTSSSGAEPSFTSDRMKAFDTSSEYDDEAPTPCDKSSHFPSRTYGITKPTLTLTVPQQGNGQGRFGDAGVRAPPQTSPFVAPLETIHSEAVLTVDANDFNDESREEFMRTLSHLEGKGSPPKFDVDNETLLHMFGHLKKGLGRDPHNSSAFVQNVAAAEKYLATRGSSILEVTGLEDGRPPNTEEWSGDATTDDHATTSATKQEIISKWSTSTPSDKALSPPSDNISQGLRPLPASEIRPKSPSLQDTVSIGYPSRIPSRLTTTNTQIVEDAATIASIPSRRSSPTLSKRKAGSVRTARVGLQVNNASFARTTASTESKKMVPTPKSGNRALSVVDTPQRGRATMMETPRSRWEGQTAPKVTRSRSKSRYVLDKINGLFSGKRDKKSIAIPPVPRIEENVVISSPMEVAVDSSPPPRPIETVRLPKFSSMSPQNQTLPRSVSRTTMRTDDTTLVDRISMKDETQCVQVLSEHLVGRARREMNFQRKERLLTFAKVLNDSLISVREAAISAETARHAAKSAQVSYEMTQKSLAMVQRLATTMIRTGNYVRN